MTVIQKMRVSEGKGKNPWGHYNSPVFSPFGTRNYRLSSCQPAAGIASDGAWAAPALQGADSAVLWL